MSYRLPLPVPWQVLLKEKGLRPFPLETWAVTTNQGQLMCEKNLVHHLFLGCSLKVILQQYLVRNKWKVFGEWMNGCESCSKKRKKTLKILKSCLRMEGRFILRWSVHILCELVLVIRRGFDTLPGGPCLRTTCMSLQHGSCISPEPETQESTRWEPHNLKGPHVCKTKQPMKGKTKNQQQWPTARTYQHVYSLLPAGYTTTLRLLSLSFSVASNWLLAMDYERKWIFHVQVEAVKGSFAISTFFLLLYLIILCLT